MKYNIEPYNSIRSKHKGSEGYAKDLKTANAQLGITNHYLIINHFLHHSGHMCEAQKMENENENEKVNIEYQHTMLHECLNAEKVDYCAGILLNDSILGFRGYMQQTFS